MVMDSFPPQGTGRIVKDISILDHHLHSRWRVYPQNVGNTALLTADAAADTFGLWAQVVPINTVPFDFDVVGLVLEQVSAPETYFIQMGYSPTAAAPGANMECGERRVKLVTHPIARATELLQIQGQHIHANNSVWGRLKTASLVADTANISVILSRHVQISAEVPMWPAFPW
ncbi:hypothetical protein ES703_00045 [subsurface metagenome]